MTAQFSLSSKKFIVLSYRKDTSLNLITTCQNSWFKLITFFLTSTTFFPNTISRISQLGMIQKKLKQVNDSLRSGELTSAWILWIPYMDNHASSAMYGLCLFEQVPYLFDLQHFSYATFITTTFGYHFKEYLWSFCTSVMSLSTRPAETHFIYIFFFRLHQLYLQIHIHIFICKKTIKIDK